MKRNFILDEEINLLGDNDLLNTKVYAENLKKAIVNAPKDKPFAVGLFGEWGSGKSSIIKTVREELEDTKTHKIKFIIYDAWKYSNDSFRRMFLLCLKNELKFDGTHLLNSFYLNESEDIEIKKKFNKTNIVILLGVYILGLLIIQFSDIQRDGDNWKFSLTALISFAGLMIAIFYKAFDELKINVQKPHLFAPEQFEDCFKEMVEKSLKNYSWAEKKLHFVNGENYIKNIEKLIIVVDNIDRCHKEMAYELLTNIKNFLGSTQNIIFIIPVDDAALRKHIVSNAKNNGNGKCDKEGEEFLRKFFNATIRIKPYHAEEMFDFAEKINIKHKLNFSPTTIDIVSKEYARNPRRIIQFFNNLSLELVAFPESFATQFECVICKLLIIREEYPDFYIRLSLNPALLNSLETMELESFYTDYSELRGFLSSTQTITLYISEADLERILSNSNVFSGISQELLKSINSLNIDEITKFIENDKIKRSTLIKYLIDKLQKGISRRTFDTEVIPKFNLITLINEKYPLEKDENQRILEAINDQLQFILEKCEIESTAKFCKSTYGQELPTITNFSVKWITDGIMKITVDGVVNLPGTEERINLALETFIKLFNDLPILKKLIKPFSVYYFRHYETFGFTDIPKEHLEILADDAFLTELISGISAFNDESIYYSDFEFLADTIKISQKITIKFFNKINELYPDFNYKTKDEIDSDINFFNSWLERIDYDLSKDIDEIRDIYTKITAARTIANSNFPARRDQDLSLNYINEILNDEDETLNFSIFCRHIFRLSNELVNITPVLIQLVSVETNRAIVNNQLVELLDQRFSLNSLDKFVISDTTYTEQSFKLLKNLFLQKNKDGFVVTDEQLSKKLQEILELIFNDSIPIIEPFNFLEDLISYDRIKKSLQNLLSNQSKKNIKKLSHKLKSLAIDAILHENPSHFSDNTEFLKAVAATGAPKHILKLVKILKTKLPDESQLNDSIEIIMEMNSVNPSDASRLISELEDYQNDESLNENVLKAIQYLQNLGGLNELSKKKK